MELQLSLPWLEAFLLTSVRVAAFMVIAPPLNHGAIPALTKSGIGLALTLAISPVTTDGYVPQSTGAFITSLALEAVVGALLGFFVYLIFAAIHAAGGMLDQMSGLAMGQTFDPSSGITGAQFTRLFAMAATVMMFTSGAYQPIVAGLARTYQGIPLGAGLSMDEPAQGLIEAFSGMFIGAVQIGGPLLAVLFLTDISLALLTKVAPSMNLFAVGFPLKIGITLSMAATVFVAIPAAIAALTDQAVSLLVGVG